MIILLHKPYGILSQFTPEAGSRFAPLSVLGLPPNVYPVGRLDADSEGMLLLTDEPE
ncbi:MAG: pseudouridine synthase, partial [Candidatus Kapabacteria bacterium]|nr:pseudouridine synthase [Candidatus Kapabacteria bacterium]